MRKWEYKYGGSTTSSHTSCPARVIKGGRCPKNCPLYESHQKYSTCSGLNSGGLGLIDHERVITDDDGRRAFVSMYHGGFPAELRSDWMKQYLEVNGLNMTIEEPKNDHGLHDVYVRFYSA